MTEEEYKDLLGFIDWYAQTREQNDYLTGILSSIKQENNSLKERLEQAKEVMRSAINGLYSGGTDTEMMDRCEEILKQFLEEE